MHSTHFSHKEMSHKEIGNDAIQWYYSDKLSFFDQESHAFCSGPFLFTSAQF